MNKEKFTIKVNYIEPQECFSQEEEHSRLVKFVSLFAQIGFKEITLNPNTTIKIDC